MESATSWACTSERGSSATIVPRLRALATSGAQRTILLPDVPTIAESGFPGFEASSWFGLLAPAGLPPSIVARLHGGTTGVLNSPDVKERLENGGFDLVASTPAEFAAYIKAEITKWAKVFRATGLKPD